MALPDRDMQQRSRNAYSGVPGQLPSDANSGLPGNSPMLVVGLVIAVVAVGGLIYSFGGHRMGNQTGPNSSPAHQITEPATPATPAPSPTTNQ